jgi:hypothetical protein
MMMEAQLMTRVQRGFPQGFAPGKQPDLQPIDNCFGLLQHGLAFCSCFCTHCVPFRRLSVRRFVRRLFSQYFSQYVFTQL